MQVRQLKMEELPEALSLAWNVFLEFDAPVYSEDGVREFQKFLSWDSISSGWQSGKFRFWGCYHGDTLTGMLATRDISHICLLFVKKELQRQGIARRLFDQAVRECGKTAREWTVHSSPYAVEVYRHLGFTATAPEQTVNGIRFMPMVFLPF